MGEKTTPLRALLAQMLVEDEAVQRCLKAAAADAGVFVPKSAGALLVASTALSRTRLGLLAAIVAELERIEGQL